MNKKDFETKFLNLIEKEKKTCLDKNHDYASDKDALSNFRKCEEFGVPAVFGCLVRMTDKDSRKIETILKGNLVSDETIIDTAKDDSVYNKIFTMLWEEFSKKKHASEILNHFREIKKLLYE
jgi:hypothetical protein